MSRKQAGFRRIISAGPHIRSRAAASAGGGEGEAVAVSEGRSGEQIAESGFRTAGGVTDCIAGCNRLHLLLVLERVGACDKRIRIDLREPGVTLGLKDEAGGVDRVREKGGFGQSRADDAVCLIHLEGHVREVDAEADGAAIGELHLVAEEGEVEAERLRVLTDGVGHDVAVVGGDELGAGADELVERLRGEGRLDRLSSGGRGVGEGCLGKLSSLAMTDGTGDTNDNTSDGDDNKNQIDNQSTHNEPPVQ